MTPRIRCSACLRIIERHRILPHEELANGRVDLRDDEVACVLLADEPVAETQVACSGPRVPPLIWSTAGLMSAEQVRVLANEHLRHGIATELVDREVAAAFVPHDPVGSELHARCTTPASPR